MNDDLISRQAAIDAINGFKEDISNCKLILPYVKRIQLAQAEEDIWLIQSLPSAPLEIIRCKDCKFMEHAVNGKGEHGYCCNNDDSPVDNNRWLDADWFCADGERRIE